MIESSDEAIMATLRVARSSAGTAPLEKRYGYRAEEVIGKDISILIPGAAGMKGGRSWTG
jgi:hypothetical protein